MTLGPVDPLDVRLNRDPQLLAPFFWSRVNTSLQLARQAGFDVYLFEGWRSPIRQASLYSEGRTAPGRIVTNAPPWESFHQFGVAGDIVGGGPGKWTWGLNYKALAPLFKAQGLEWAGDWVNFPEAPHFQFTGGLSIAEANAILKVDGILGVWAHIAAALAAKAGP